MSFYRLSLALPSLRETAERITNESIPIIPAGIAYQIGATWLAQLNFGPAVYRRDFSSRRQLIEHVADAVKQLCAVQKTT